MKKLRALLVDDEAPARARLKRMLEKELEISGEASNGLEALERIEALKPDVVFLDIEMPELGGLDVARTLAGREGAPVVVFVTAYDEFALQAFEAHAADYLVKPVAEARLKATLDRLRARASEPEGGVRELLARLSGRAPERLAVKSGKRYVVVDLERVSAIVAKDHYSVIQLENRELLGDESLDEFEKKLDPARFLRVHRGAIVNLSFIKELEREGDRKFTVILSTPADPARGRIPVARERLEELKKRLGLS